MSFLITQFAAGLEPCVDAVRLALAVNAEMERRGKERYRLLVPWLEGDRQRRRLQDAFGEEDRRHPEEILLDERLGRILAPFLSNESGYAVAVAIWVAGWEDAGRAVRAHYNQDIGVFNLAGGAVAVGKPNIALELHRAPRFHFGLARAYHVTHCRLSQLFTAMETERGSSFALGRELLFSAQKAAAEIERNLTHTFVSVPGTFTSPDALLSEFRESELVPYLTSIPASSPRLPIDEKPTEPTPARWEAISLSLLEEKPLWLAPFDVKDDPEMYFNGENAVRWGFATRDPHELNAVAPTLKTLNEKLRRHFGTLDGISVAARAIVDDVLREPRPAYE